LVNTKLSKATYESSGSLKRTILHLKIILAQKLIEEDRWRAEELERQRAEDLQNDPLVDGTENERVLLSAATTSSPRVRNREDEYSSGMNSPPAKRRKVTASDNSTEDRPNSQTTGNQAVGAPDLMLLQDEGVERMSTSQQQTLPMNRTTYEEKDKPELKPPTLYLPPSVKRNMKDLAIRRGMIERAKARLANPNSGQYKEYEAKDFVSGLYSKLARMLSEGADEKLLIQGEYDAAMIEVRNLTRPPLLDDDEVNEFILSPAEVKMKAQAHAIMEEEARKANLHQTNGEEGLEPPAEPPQ